MKKRNKILLSIVLSACLVLLLAIFSVTKSNTLNKDKLMYTFLYNGVESFKQKFPDDFSKYYINVSCIDHDDNLVEARWDSENKKVNITNDEILKAITPITCTLNLYEEMSLINQLSSDIITSVVSHTIGENSYRYTGQNPDNYIWFNNEMWRIIGVIPACTAPSEPTCSTYTPLVKIIRHDSIGTISFDATNTISSKKNWNDSTLKKLLNEYYFISQNGTDTDYCYGHKAVNKINCDYQKIGLGGTDSYYGSMVKNVYWNVGEIDSFSQKTEGVYKKETVTISLGNVGLINLSDYGFASTKYDDKKLNEFSEDDAASSNWLYGKGELWTINPKTVGNNVAYISGTGNAADSDSSSGYQVHPVVYLKENINVVAGDGTYSNPYQIALDESTATS